MRGSPAPSRDALPFGRYEKEGSAFFLDAPLCHCVKDSLYKHNSKVFLKRSSLRRGASAPLQITSPSFVKEGDKGGEATLSQSANTNMS